MVEVAEAVAPPQRLLSGFGGRHPARSYLVAPRSEAELEALIPDGPASGTIARGAGCAYGDAAQRDRGRVIDMQSLAGVREFDADRGLVRAFAGTTLATLIAEVGPHGWMLPVAPGTMRVTLGGAIAADIHGKSHHCDGSFGDHVTSLRLLRADGELIETQPGDAAFEATLGGMGLTGVVVDATVRLQRIPSTTLAVDTDRVDDLEAAIASLYEDGGRRYSVAWLDLLGSPRGRGIVTRADYASSGETELAPRARRVPAVAARLLRSSAVRAHNELRFRLAPRRARGRPEALVGHLFPLDGLAGWNRLYDRVDGLVQYQFVVPSGAEPVVGWVIERLRSARMPVYLAVLKQLGPAAGRPLSFPLEGLTLACDIPGAAVDEKVLGELDQRVIEAGGRVNLAKDGRLGAETLAAMYPQLGAFQQARDSLDPDRRLRSDLSQRLDI